MGDDQFWKQLAILQMTSAALSFVSSAAMVAVMAFSTCRLLSSPYSRIIFGLSVSDALLSFAFLVGPFSVPAYVPQALWGIGNDITCTVDGFVLKMSQPLMYSSMLCFYFLCRLCKNMSDRDFNKKIEWKLHVFIVLYGLVDAIASLLTGTLNTSSSGTICTTAPFPAGCRQRPEIFGECDPFSLRISSILAIINSAKSIVSVSSIITCMSVISYRAIKVFEVARHHYPSSSADHDADHDADHEADADPNADPNADPDEITDEITEMADLTGQLDKWNQLTKETVVQTSLYATGFLLTHFPMLVYRHFFRHKGSTPEILLIVLQTLFPLGGFFNILIYTRGSVLSFRREHPEYLWCQAFYEVLKAGGQVPNESQLSGRNVVLTPMRNLQVSSVPYGVLRRHGVSLVGSYDIAGNGFSNCSMNESNVAFRMQEEWHYVPGNPDRKEIDEREEDSDFFPISLDVHQNSIGSSLTRGVAFTTIHSGTMVEAEEGQDKSLLSRFEGLTHSSQ